ncbi:MAG TPA: hypothetical protein VGF17_22475, partial [Phytomonospora sp.]
MDEADALLEAARRAGRRGEADVYERLLTEAAALGHGHALNDLGILRARDGDMDAARALWTRAVEAGAVLAAENLAHDAELRDA